MSAAPPPPDTEAVWLTADRPDAGELGLCVHCGFCLNVCPTYHDLGVETNSPRGRIALMRGLDSGRIAWSPRVQQHFDQCLQCRACETACPSKVPYGRLMEATRAEAFAQRKGSRRQRALWQLVMRGVFPYPRRMRLAGYGLKLYQRSGLQAFVRKSGLLRRLAPKLAQIDALSPRLDQPFYANREAERCAPAEPVRARAALVTGCMMPLAFPETHRATVRVFARNGVSVSAPASQVCCGALHAHGGDVEAARGLARRNIEAFTPESCDPPDAILINAAGCGSHLKEYGHLLRNDQEYAQRAAAFAARVRDVHEYLVEIGFAAPEGRIERTVTYQDSCHLSHAQNLRKPPREILGGIPGLMLREMRTPDKCCGSAGLYSVAQSDISARVLAEKMQDLLATDADQVCTANPGCMLQLDAGMAQYDAAGRMMPRSAHAIELLDESYRLGDDARRRSSASLTHADTDRTAPDTNRAGSGH